ncbi:hypothetical protein EG329_000625 [Mollisiaceae sp. DMI_Dod_QoI]|nr:hypothetical protein EG329_000625 [Helotiales sp. DMI_Dod_QoI]
MPRKSYGLSQIGKTAVSSRTQYGYENLVSAVMLRRSTTSKAWPKESGESRHF